MLKYFVSYYSITSRVKVVEVTRETEDFVVLPGKAGESERKERKVSSCGRYYDSFSDAKQELVKRLQNEIERLAYSLGTTKRLLENAQELTEPGGKE